MNWKNLLFTIAIAFLNSLKGANGQVPNLGSASDFALFTSIGAFTNLGSSMVTGDVGTNAGLFSGFPPGTIIGNIHVVDPVSLQASTDLSLAYSYLDNLPCGQVLGVSLGNGQVLTPNTYCLGAAATLSGNLTLDALGNPDALFIFQIDGALTTSTFSAILLANSASLSNVYWQINGQFSLGDYSEFKGNILANGAINLLEGSSLQGRGLSIAGAISLHNNNVNIGLQPIASIISANGPTSFCPNGSVVLSGNIGGVWSNGATSPSITVILAGDYFVTNSNDFGSVTSNHIVVSLDPLPVASVISASGPVSFCAPGSVVLTGNAGGTWSNGATTPEITVNVEEPVKLFSPRRFNLTTSGGAKMRAFAG